MSKFYITTTLPYVNDRPHLGHALEFVQADVVARYRRLKGDEVFFNIGTDEHGSKIYERALEENMEPQAFCDKYAKTFIETKDSLGLSYDNFIRTTDEHHVMAATKFWVACEKKGDIYKKNYKAKYCVGCEMEMTDSELVDGRCPDHPNRDLEVKEEENYFFKFSNYQERLLDFYKKTPDFVAPQFRFNEIIKFVEGGLQDFSISRLKSKLPWGVGVPGDESQVVYVWFDALVNYVSAIGWPDRMGEFKDWWPAVQVAGKNNLRQQSAMWQAMLMSAGLSPSKQVFIHGFINAAGGQKMSKSLGNVINPFDVAEKYGVEVLRFYLLKGLHPFEDSEFTYERLEGFYNADLANGLGNLVSRITNLIDKSGLTIKIDQNKIDKELELKVGEHLDNYRFDEALKVIWQKITESDVLINDNRPWKLIKDVAANKERLEGLFVDLAQRIYNIAYFLQPFLPETAEKILKNVTAEKIEKSDILFPRLVNTHE